MRAKLTLRQIEALREIAAAGSLVAASQRLNMTPAALTARIKALEDTLGVTLFDRLPQGLKPNRAGEVALEAAAKIDLALRDFTERMEALRTGTGGRLCVGVVSTAKYFAPRLVARFMAAHAGLDLRLMIGNRGEIIDALADGGIEVALMGRPPADPPTERVAIGPHPYVIIAAPAHRLVGRRRAGKKALAGEPFLFREEGSGSRSLFEYFIGDIPVQRAQFGIELGSNETIKQAVMAGLGIALISAHTVAAEVADGRLALLDIAGLPIVRQWYVVNRTDRMLTPAAAKFRDFAVDHCADVLPVLTPRM